MGCVYWDLDVGDEMNATTMHDSVAKTMKRYPDSDMTRTMQIAASNGKQT